MTSFIKCHDGKGELAQLRAWVVDRARGRSILLGNSIAGTRRSTDVRFVLWRPAPFMELEDLALRRN